MYLVACDFDGTLKMNDQVSQEDIDAIVKFREAGNKFVICTGRTINSVYHQLMIHKIPFDYIIGVNGAIAINPDYHVIFSHEFDKAIFKDVQSVLGQYDLSNYQISNGFDFKYVNKGETIREEDINVGAIRGYFIILQEQKDALVLAEELNDLLLEKGITAYSNNSFVALGMTGVHKAYGASKLAEKINFRGRIIAIGDDFNDIPMFKKFESYGIKTGYPEAITYAKHKVSNVREVLLNLMDESL